MEANRRRFLKLTAAGVLGIVARPFLHVLSKCGVAHAASAQRALSAKRWGMVVDLRKCAATGECSACIEACHKVHNVPDFNNPKDEIRWIGEIPFEETFPEQQHEFVTEGLKGASALILCNHCDDPPCVKVCPTKATWRRDDGTVMMDYHRCIGCRYCMAACPYGSRSFNWKDPRPGIKEINIDYPTRSKGVVEKCNFCQERLAKGLMPACVEACQENALIFGDLDDPNSDVRKALGERYTIRRKPGLGTEPKVYYIV